MKSDGAGRFVWSLSDEVGEELIATEVHARRPQDNEPCGLTAGQAIEVIAMAMKV